MVIAEMINLDNIGENVYSGIFGVTSDELIIRFLLFKIADLRWRQRKWKTAIILVKI